MVGSVGFVPAAPERTTETDDCWVSTLGSNICEQRCVICAYMAALTSEMSERVSQPTETYHSKIWIAVSLAPWDLGRTETVTSGDVERWSSGGKWWQWRENRIQKQLELHPRSVSSELTPIGPSLACSHIELFPFNFLVISVSILADVIKDLM